MGYGKGWGEKGVSLTPLTSDLSPYRHHTVSFEL